MEPTSNLEHRVKAVLERVKVGPGRLHVVAAGHGGAHFELAAKDLRAEEGEDAEKEEEEDEERDDGLDRVDERGQQVLQRLPVPVGGRGRVEGMPIDRAFGVWVDELAR